MVSSSPGTFGVLTRVLEAFPRSKTIAFNDEDDGMSHAFHDRGATTAREGGFFPRTATQRSQGEDGESINAVAADIDNAQVVSLVPALTPRSPVHILYAPL